MTLEKIQEIGMMMISKIGLAKSNYVESLSESREGNFERAKQLIQEADLLKIEAHTEHFGLIQLEASGNQLPFSLILMHAEDQLLTCEVFHKIALEHITLYTRIKKLEDVIIKD
ncbi:hypothetical protein AOC36_08105 [Erysipelothrix larvae]|uniref:PTS cellobiose transporter subunit IIA n=1 Tax=Erysipelothrix larvae TaxID=1514105 RepID=A0A0X8H0W2_9FIRM|nr:PTS lactose/cellobiose transporter subunit IIA [Erysipelothrix larvae]AMC93950.1 hypothetical protein AOC36_08105 [Erysipelothrix larvae]